MKKLSAVLALAFILFSCDNGDMDTTAPKSSEPKSSDVVFQIKYYSVHIWHLVPTTIRELHYTVLVRTEECIENEIYTIPSYQDMEMEDDYEYDYKILEDYNENKKNYDVNDNENIKLYWEIDKYFMDNFVGWYTIYPYLEDDTVYDGIFYEPGDKIKITNNLKLYTTYYGRPARPR